MAGRWFDSSRQIFWDNNQQNLTVPGSIISNNISISTATFSSISVGNVTTIIANTVLGTSSIVAPVSFYAQELYTTTPIDTSQIGTTWTPVESSRLWRGIAISASGQYQSAVVYGGTIYISNDYGLTWTSVESSREWDGIAMSASGQYQSAVVYFGLIYISNNYGVTWTAVASLRNWKDIAMSASGQYQSAFEENGLIYISNNYGNTWTAVESLRNWYNIAMSASGQYQSAVVYGGNIYISNNYGATWTPVASSRDWSSIAMSASGQYQSAVEENGLIYISNNYGTTWTAVASSIRWVDIAMSASGQYQSAVVYSGRIYISNNYGSDWAPVESSRNWNGIAMSASGQYQLAIVNNGTLYRSAAPSYYQTSIGINCNAPRFALDVNGSIAANEFIINTPAYSYVTTTGMDRIYTAPTSELNLGGNDFTMECFFNPSATPGTWGSILSIGEEYAGYDIQGREFRISQRIGGGGFGMIVPLTDPTPPTYDNYLSITDTLPLNQWYHLALVRSTNTATLFSNGIGILSTPVNVIFDEDHELYIFSSGYGGDPSAQGQINSVRVITGQALYRGNFTPPTSQLTAVSVGTTGPTVATSISGDIAVLTAVTSTIQDSGPHQIPLTVDGSPTVRQLGAFSTFATYGTNTSITGSMQVGRGAIINGSVGINCNSPQYELDVNGIVRASGYIGFSDQRVKQAIENADLSCCYSTMQGINLKYFQWDPVFQSSCCIQDNHRLGFLAQDIKEVFPNSVFIRSNYGFNDFHSLETEQLQAMHFGATKKLMDLVEQLGSTLQGTREELSTLRG